MIATTTTSMTAEELYQIAKKAFPFDDEETKINKVNRILNAIMETKNDYDDVLANADYIANVANEDYQCDGLEDNDDDPLYISGDDCFDFLYAIGFRGNDVCTDDADMDDIPITNFPQPTSLIDFGDCDI